MLPECFCYLQLIVIYIPCTSHLCVSLWVFTWMGWYCNLTIHTLLINYLYCFVIVCAKIPQGTDLPFFCFVLCTFIHVIQLWSLVAIFFILGGAFPLNAESYAWQTTSCMHCRSSETLVYLWSTSYTALNDKPLILRCTVRFVQWTIL